MILTSGTTGTPKGAQRSSPDGLLAMAALIDKIPYRSRETIVIAAPLFHSWGFLHFVDRPADRLDDRAAAPLRPGGDACRRCSSTAPRYWRWCR